MIRQATPDDLDFVNRILAANGLPEWSRERYDDLSRDCLERTMLIDEGVGFAAAGMVAGSKDEAYSSHMLRVPTDTATLLGWHRTMIKAMLTLALEKVPKLKKVRVKLARQIAATCVSPATLRNTSGVLVDDDSGDNIELVIDPKLVLDWAKKVK